MYKKELLLIFIVWYLAACSSPNKYDQAIDYFYPLKEGQTYIYSLKFGTDLINKAVKVEEIKRQKNGVRLRISESQNIPESVRNKWESAEGIKVPEIIKHEYEYILQNNLIKRKQIFGGKQPEEFIYLKGPRKKGISWKVSTKFFPILETGEHEEKESFKHFDIKATISEIREENVLGQVRRCIVITHSYPPSDPFSLKFEEKLVFCRGIGFIYFDDGPGEKLVEIVPSQK